MVHNNLRLGARFKSFYKNKFSIFYIRTFTALVISLCVLTLSGFSNAQSGSELSPIAEPGSNRVITLQSAMQLDGTGSISPTNTSLTYAWELTQIPEGSFSNLSDPNSARPEFTPDLPGEYIASLIVTDGAGNISDAQTVRLSTENLPPVAVAGADRSMLLGQSIRFDPEGSYDANGDRLEAEWSILSFPAILGEALLPTLTEDEGGRFIFTPNASGEYQVELSVEDINGASSTDSVTIYVAQDAAAQTSVNANIAPVANAGLNGIPTIGQAVFFDGSGSTDVNGDSLTYAWSVLSKPAASNFVLEGATNVRASFIPDLAGLYVMQLQVTDSGGKRSFDTVVLSSQGNAPNAISGGPEAGADGAINNEQANVDGALSVQNSGGTNLEYSWSVLGLSSGENEVVDPDAVGTNISFVPSSASGEGSLAAAIASGFGAIEVDENGDLYIIDVEAGETLLIIPNFNFGDGGIFLDVGREEEARLGTDGSDRLVGTSDVDIILGGDGEDILIGRQGHDEVSGGNGDDSLRGNRGEDILYGDRGDDFLDGRVDNDRLIGGAGNDRLLGRDGDDLLSGGINNDILIGGLGSDRLIGGACDDVITTDEEDGSNDQNDQDVVVLGDLIARPSGNDIILDFDTDNFNGGENNFDTLTFTYEGVDYSLARGRDFVDFVDTIEHDGDRETDAIREGDDLILVFGRTEDGQITKSVTLKDIIGDDGITTSRLNAASVDTLTARDVFIELCEFPDEADIDAETVNALFGEVAGEPTNFALVQLAVSDRDNPQFGPSFSSTVLTTGNLRPIADFVGSAGLESIAPNIEITFDAGVSSDGDGDSLSYDWSILHSPTISDAQLDTANLQRPTLTPQVSGDYVIQLIVSDGELTSLPVTLILTIQNTAPIANAGQDQAIATGQLVSLNGGASQDPDGDALTYAWSFTARPAGSEAALINASSVSPDFETDVPGDYVIALVVNDGTLSSDIDDVRITATNIAPIAVISGPSTGEIGEALTFTGVGSSDADGDDLSYIWTVATPDGSNLGLVEGSEVAFQFMPDVSGDYIVSLTVSDGFVLSETVTNLVTIEAPNSPPVLDAIDAQTISVGSTASVQFSASDPDGDDLTFSVSPSPLPTGASLNSDTGLFTYSALSRDPDNLTFNVTVSDGEASSTGSFSISVTSDNVLETTYSGQVIDAVTGEPIEGARVFIVNSDSTVTNSEGRFILTNLPPGQVTICVELNDPDRAYTPLRFPVTLIQFADNQAPEPIGLVEAIDTTPYIVGEDIILESSDNLDVRIEISTESLSSVSARYWRVLVNEIPNSSERASIGEVAFRTQTGDVPLSAFASSEFRSSLAAELAIDGIASTGWNANSRGGSGDWLAVDFGAGQSVSVISLEMTARGSTTFAPQQTPISFDIEYSQDAENWEAISSETTSEWVALENRIFAIENFSPGALISLSALSADQVSNLPDGLEPCGLFVLGPKNFSISGQTFFSTENFDNLPAGTEVDVWMQVGQRFEIVGTGQVIGNRIETAVEGVIGGAPIGFAPRFHDITLSSDQPGTYLPRSLLGDGALRTVIGLPSYGSLGGPDTTGLIYNSRAADSSALITGTASFGEARPDTLTSSVSLPGTAQSFENVINVNGQSEIAQSAVVNGDGLESGVYPVSFLSTARYSCSTITASTTARVPLEDPADNPFGPGWSVAEIQRLDINDQGVSIRQGDGSVLQFDAPLPTIFEDFSDNFGGWGLDGLSEGLSYQPTGGNPGGHLREIDILSEGQIVYWRAPDGLLPRLTEFIGGIFSYDMRQSSTTRQFGVSEDVVVETSLDERLFFDYPDSVFPGTGWTRFEIPLRADAWNIRRADDSVEIPTDEEFRTLLENATVFRFRAEHRTGSDTVFLDNAGFGPETTELDNGQLVSTSFESVSGDFSTLQLTENGTFERRYPDGTQTIFDQNGLHIATIDRNGNQTSYSYDEDDRVTEITDPSGQVTRFIYQGNTLASIIDPSGRETLFAYDSTGALVEVTEPDDETTMFTYDDNARLISTLDPRGFETTHDYGPDGSYQGSTRPDGTSIGLSVARSLGLDSLGTLENPVDPQEPRSTETVDGRGNVTNLDINEFGAIIRAEDPLGRVTLFERDENNLVRVIDEPSSVTESGRIRSELDYDVRGNVTARREAVATWLEREMTYEYEPVFSQLIRMVDYDGFESVMSYDDRGNKLSEVDPEGGEYVMTYDERGLLVTRIDKVGNITTYEYDQFGRLERMIDPSSDITRLTLDAAGNVLIRTEAVGTEFERRILMGYDEQDRMIIETAADGGTTNYVYDDEGNLTDTIDPTNIRETRSYDSRDRLETINDPASGTTVFVYDEDSNITRMTDALGDTTDFTYDAVDRLLSSIDARGQLRAFAYDLRDNITAVTDARANNTFMQYDKLDRPIAKTNPNDEQWNFAYDLRDNPISTIKPDGVTITANYDALSRLKKIVGGDIERNYSYDAQSNILGANDELAGIPGAILTYLYDRENRVETASVGNLFGNASTNNVFSYSYDALDRRASMTDSFDGNWAYGYDPVDRLTKVVTPRGESYTTEYDLAGRMLARMAPNATAMARAYEDDTGRLSQQDQSSGANLFNGFSYDYTDRGNIDAIIETGAVARTRNYSYDELERLTSVESPDAPINVESYSLDPEGNRLESHLSDTHQTDDANRLAEDDAYSYVYDLNGNLLSKTAKPGIDRPDWEYGYDTFDQLIAVTRDGVEVERYRYDAFGRRSAIDTIDQTGNFVRVAIVNDGSDRTIDLIEVSNGIGFSAAEIKSRYSHGGQADEVLSLEVFNSDGSFDQAYTYHADHLGSIRFITDSVGEIVNAYDYDSYGRPSFTLETINQPFRYTGREFDKASELYHYRARQYDPESGRFIQEDPIGFAAGDLNIHRYVGNNPVSYTDPSGLTPASETGAKSAQSAGLIGPVGQIGIRVQCLFATAFAAVELATNPDLNAVDIGVEGFGLALECGLKLPKKTPKICPIGKKGGKCFAAGTKVHTRDGLKNIEEIVPGDFVKSMDAFTGEIAYKEVLKTHVNSFDPTGVVTLIDDNDGSETVLSVTAEHPFHVPKYGWVHASKLSSGDLVTSDNRRLLRVKNVVFNKHAPVQTTYNLEVSEFHTYFVGEDGVLVHNGFGSYFIGDGKNWYIGKGDINRMKSSINRLFPGGVTQSDHFPAGCDKSSFKKEHELMMNFTKGLHPREVKNLFNQIRSPGAKY